MGKKKKSASYLVSYHGPQNRDLAINQTPQTPVIRLSLVQAIG